MNKTTMQRSLAKIRSLQITAHLNKSFSSSMWRTTKNKKLTKTNTIKLSISSLFSLIQLKIIESWLWKANFISNEIDFRHHPTIRFSFICSTLSIQIYFLSNTKQFHSSSKFSPKNSFRTADFTSKYLQFTLLKNHKSSSFWRKKTRRVKRTVHRSNPSVRSIHFAKSLKSIKTRISH